MQRTLATVIVNIGIGGVVLDGFLETLECLRRVTLFHPYACNLDPCLRHGWLELERREEVSLGAVHVRHEELEGPTEVQGLRLSDVPRDALLNRLVGESIGVRVVGGIECLQRENQRVVACRRFRGQLREWS